MFHLVGPHQEEFRARFIAVTTLVLVLFTMLFFRVWYLQILQGRKFKEFSEKNRISIKNIPAKRGRILDRSGKVIADSRPSFDLLLTPSQVEPSIEDEVERLAALLNWSEEDRLEILQRIKGSGKHDPVVIRRDMGRDEVAKILVRQYAFSGLQVIHTPARTYPFGKHGSHYLGFLGELNKRQLTRLREQGNTFYRLGDVWGVAGIEKTFENSLRGKNGARSFVEDAWGREVGEERSGDLLPAFRPSDSIPGEDVVLAIDTRVQEAAEEVFEEKTGAIVAIDPRNGDVLALVSRPEYSPGEFVRGVSSSYWKTLVEDPQNPLFDRALQGLFPPASTFKFIVALAVLEEQAIDPEDTVYCPGYYRIGRERKRCWKSVGHGPMNMHQAIKHSCDVYFYEMGKRLGIERIAAEARKFGLGEATGIGINLERKGLVPTEAWKRKVYNEPWVGGETLSVAIGQGALQVTPIQMAVALATLVNGGTMYQPRVALRTQTVDGDVSETYGVKIRKEISIPESHRSLLVNALRGVVNEIGGTAFWSARSNLVEIGGKTGTAQVVGRRSGLKIEDHSWFVGFAPVEHPEIVIAVIVEHGGHGSSVAAPMTKKIIEAYLGGTG